MTFTNVLENHSNHCLECKAGSGSPLYLMMQKRYETECIALQKQNCYFSKLWVTTVAWHSFPS